MIVLNFAHPLTEAHHHELERLTGAEIGTVQTITTQFDPEQPFALQTRRLCKQAGLTSEAWQTEPLLIVLPSLSVIAAALLAEIHGRCGYFPAVLRLKPVPDTLPPRFEAVEVLNLQTLRDQARASR